ncbi:hypothetical protein PRIPAC_95745 [Pristionchus pacificus]|uniref:Uncharacterized protein n=1 Tax=Pristionchus pacificus TaxID=54126 RepID=A0A2A6B2S5_PRIPA|nr:hypothetical protein PRIPAC_95745 [Pristionchus pacificus]|eukprot:PDM60163.1 hypothetical protein PRIPAC_53988 [Pristionchus pacificus]
MNATQCSVFRDLSHSVEYHLLTATKGILCSVGAFRITSQWRQYGVRFLVHENTKIIFRFFLALNIVIAAIFGCIHLFELIRMRCDCFLLDFRYILLTRGFGMSLIYASQHLMLLLSFERLYSAIFPAYFERNSSCFLSISLAIITIIGTVTFGMTQLSDNFRSFNKLAIYLAFLNLNIPLNQQGFDNLVSKMAISNSVALITLCLDFYINFQRNAKQISPSLAVSYQLISCPTLVGHQVFHESVTLSVCFPLILTFLIKHSAEKNLNRPHLKEPEVDHFAELRKSWDRLSAQHKDERTIKYATSRF